MADVLPFTKLQKLYLSKNILGDESLMFLGNSMKYNAANINLYKIDFSQSRISDKGIIYFVEKIQQISSLKLFLANHFRSKKKK